VHPAWTASTNGTITMTVDPSKCGSNLDPPRTEPTALPPPLPKRKGPDPAKRRAAKAARKARKKNR